MAIFTGIKLRYRGFISKIEPKSFSVVVSVKFKVSTFCQGGVPEVPHTHGGALLGGALVGGGPSRCQRISYA